jgi:protein-tyrosine-phosphatase
MEPSKRVLFVCTGNTCRSPLAEGLLRKAVEGRDDVEVRSAGVSAMPGAPASRQTIDALKRRGISLDGFRSRMVDEEILDWATHVFAMTRGHLDAIARVFPEADEKLHLACEFVDLPGRGVGADVPDPIGGGRETYEEVARVLELAIPGILGILDAEA